MMEVLIKWKDLNNFRYPLRKVKEVNLVIIAALKQFPTRKKKTLIIIKLINNIKTNRMFNLKLLL